MFNRRSLEAFSLFAWIFGGLITAYFALSWLANSCRPITHGQSNQESWWGQFFCEMKASDAAIAFLTYALVIVGWFGIRRSERASRDENRAYVSGGGPWLRMAPPMMPQIVGFRFTADNYGKTPATIIEYSLIICEHQKIPRVPKYSRRGYVRTVYRGTLKPNERATIVTDRPITNIQRPVAYGRIGTKIFGERSTTSVLSCRPLRSPEITVP